MLENHSAGTDKLRMRDSTIEPWMWTLAGISWGGIIGLLVSAIAIVNGSIGGDQHFIQESIERQMALFLEGVRWVAVFTLQGVLIGAAASCIMSCLSAAAQNWPARFFVAAVLGALVSAMMGAVLWWGYWQAAFLYAPAGLASALLATASVRRMAARTSIPAHMPADPPTRLRGNDPVRPGMPPNSL